MQSRKEMTTVNVRFHDGAPEMTLQVAVNKAKEFVEEVFRDEKPQDIGLEEVEHKEDPGRWLITIGFTREIERKSPFRAPARRVYKIVEIEDNARGDMIAIRNRETADV